MLLAPMLLSLGAIVLFLPTLPAQAQTARPPSAAAARPTWNELSPAQREALAPLAGDWNTLDADRKQKWLEVAAKYPRLSPDGKRRLQERMAEYARLTPEQRKTARENFRRAYELPADQRQSALQHYQELDASERKALGEQAGKKAEPPRRSTRELRGDRKPPAER